MGSLFLSVGAYQLASDVFTAEGNGFKFIATAGQGPQTGVPTLESPLEELDGLAGLFLNHTGIAPSPVVCLLPFGQAVQLVDHWEDRTPWGVSLHCRPVSTRFLR